MPDTLRIQPLPVLTLVGEMGGTTSVTRVWAGGDHELCRLCPPGQCDAREIPGGLAACMILTEEAVTDGGAPLYSSAGLDFGPGTARDRAPLGLAR